MPKGTNMLETQTYHDPLDLSGSLWLEGQRGSGTVDPGGLSDQPAGSAELGSEGVGNRSVSHPRRQRMLPSACHQCSSP